MNTVTLWGRSANLKLTNQKSYHTHIYMINTYIHVYILIFNDICMYMYIHICIYTHKDMEIPHKDRNTNECMCVSVAENVYKGELCDVVGTFS